MPDFLPGMDDVLIRTVRSWNKEDEHCKCCRKKKAKKKCPCPKFEEKVKSDDNEFYYKLTKRFKY